jgi:hypothetical protein
LGEGRKGPKGIKKRHVAKDIFWACYTNKKRKTIFLTYRQIQMGSGAKSYMRKGCLIYEEMHKYFHHI